MRGLAWWVAVMCMYLGTAGIGAGAQKVQLSPCLEQIVPGEAMVLGNPDGREYLSQFGSISGDVNGTRLVVGAYYAGTGEGRVWEMTCGENGTYVAVGNLTTTLPHQSTSQARLFGLVIKTAGGPYRSEAALVYSHEGPELSRVGALSVFDLADEVSPAPLEGILSMVGVSEFTDPIQNFGRSGVVTFPRDTEAYVVTSANGFETSSGIRIGYVHVFSRASSTPPWNASDFEYVETFTNESVSSDEYLAFGSSMVMLSDSVLAVGAPQPLCCGAGSEQNTGFVFLYEAVGEPPSFVYREEMVLGNPQAVTTDFRCGEALAFVPAWRGHAAQLMVGCPGYSGFSKMGAVMVMEADIAGDPLGGWHVVQRILFEDTPDAFKDAGFGSAIAVPEYGLVNDDLARLVMYVSAAKWPAGAYVGLVLQYLRTDSGWELNARFEAPPEPQGSKFGNSITMFGAGDVFAASATSFDDLAGAAFVFRCPDGWYGDNCGQPRCVATCSDATGGVCVAPDQCQCTTAGYVGPGCNELLTVQMAAVTGVSRTVLNITWDATRDGATVDQGVTPTAYELFVNGLPAYVGRRRHVSLVDVIPNTRYVVAVRAADIQDVAANAAMGSLPHTGTEVVSLGAAAVAPPALAETTDSSEPLVAWTACPSGMVDAAQSSVENRICSECLAGTYANDATSTCDLCPERATSPAQSPSILSCVCVQGAMTRDVDQGLSGVACIPCVSGGHCSGGTADPAPLPGYYRISRSVFRSCDPPEACVGGTNATCEAGYTGFMCRECARDHFYSSGECRACPAAASLLTLLFVALVILFALFVFAVAVLALGGKTGEKGVAPGSSQGTGDNLSAMMGTFAFVCLSLTVSLFQLLALIGRMRMNWPSAVRSSSSAMGVTLLDSSVFAQECVFGGGFTRSYLTHLALPLLVALVFVVAKCLLLMAARVSGRAADWIGDKAQGTAALVRATVIVVPPLLLPVSRGTLALFDCTRLPDGNYYVDSDREMRCYQGTWFALLPFGIIATVGYVVLPPLLLAGSVFRHHNHLSTAPVLMRYGSLYVRFRKRFFYWECTNLGKRLLIVVVDVFLTSHPFYQLFCLFALLLLSMITHISLQPYNRPLHNRFAVICDVVVLCMLFLASMFRAGNFPTSAAHSFATALTVGLLVAAMVLSVAFNIAELLVMRKALRSGNNDANPYAVDDSLFFTVSSSSPQPTADTQVAASANEIGLMMDDL